MRILHLSADYPDPVQPRKTRAIANLIALVPEHAHRVLSLNRRGGLADPGAWAGGVAAAPFEDAAGSHLAMTYRAPPMGSCTASSSSGWPTGSRRRRARSRPTSSTPTS